MQRKLGTDANFVSTIADSERRRRAARWRTGGVGRGAGCGVLTGGPSNRDTIDR